MKEKIRFTNVETASICEALSYLLHAGITYSDALYLIADDESDTTAKSMLTDMAKKSDNGSSLSDVFVSSGCFDPYVGHMISVGESSGRIEDALNGIADACNKRASLDRQIKSALVYPSVLLLIMLAVVAVLLIFVLPVFDEVYSQLGSGLTGLAGGFLAIGRILGAAAPLLIAVFIAAIAFLVIFSSVPSFRDKVLVFLWGRGEKSVFSKIKSARFAQALAMATASGLNIEDAVLSSAAVDEDARMIAKGEKCVEMLRNGCTVADALKNSGLIPAYESRLLEAGVQSGMESKAMYSISERLTEEGENALCDKISSVEPIMVIISSLLVGIILLSVMLPLINVMSAIG